MRKTPVILRSDLGDLGTHWEMTSGLLGGLLKQSPSLLQNPVYLCHMSGDGVWTQGVWGLILCHWQQLLVLALIFLKGCIIFHMTILEREQCSKQYKGRASYTPRSHVFKCQWWDLSTYKKKISWQFHSLVSWQNEVFLTRQNYFLFSYFSVAWSRTRSVYCTQNCLHLCTSGTSDQHDQNMNFKGKCCSILLRRWSQKWLYIDFIQCVYSRTHVIM